ncbi:MAG: TIGR01777 family oxidoreductase [Gammaproteobacteria bacterium]|nr:TIGR01777 family oxidoreductase [Gammaproteobacteria bacterium]
MKILIGGGSGFIGSALAIYLERHGHDITVISRESSDRHYASVTWQELTATLLSQFDVVINLAGANIGEKRWTEKRKQEILSSRVDTTKRIVDCCIALGAQAPRLLNASAIGAYAQQAPNLISPTLGFDETITVVDKKSFLNQVANAWEQATIPAKEAGVSVVNMRFAVVLGASGGVLKQLRLPYLLGLGGRIGNGKQSFSWVALTDVLRAIDFLLAHPELQGPINIVAPGVVKQKKFARRYAASLNRRGCLPTPAWLLKIIFGQMAEELLLQGQKVVPQRLLDAGFVFESLGEPAA